MLVKAVTTVASLAAVSSAHMIMISPVPYGKSSLNNSPLDASGSDFPCKMRSNAFAPEGASNVFPQGSTQQLQFQGSAVHGGGSCQVSVTSDAQPNKNSVWKVIKSIEGGCPAKGAAGNIGNSPDAKSGDKYAYTIPAEMPAGNYTLAWTWFNKVGNREMYMNCAPLTVQGSAGSGGFLETLPDMMVANLKSVGDCATKEGADVKFPSPGKDVDRPNGEGSLGAPVGNCKGGGSGGGKGPAPSGNGPAPTQSAGYPNGGSPSGAPNGGSPSGAPSVAPIASAPSGAPTSAGYPSGAPTSAGYPGGAPSAGAPSGAPTSAGYPSGAPTSAGYPGGVFMTVPTGAPAATGSPSSPTAAKPAGPAPAGGFAVGTPCTSEGEWNCVDGTSFQRCASGAWSSMSPMANGMKCSSGQSANIKMTGANARRAMRRAFRFAA